MLAPQSPQAVPWAREHGLLRLTRLTSSLGREGLSFYPSRVKATIVLVTFLHKGLVAQSLAIPGCQYVPLRPSLSVRDAGDVPTSICSLQWVKGLQGEGPVSSHVS